MELLRIFTNNLVLARDASGREVVLTGRGLGFQARPGRPVDSSKVVRTFVPDEGRNADNFAQLLASIPPEHIDLAARSVDLVRGELDHPLAASTLVALAERIVASVNAELEVPLDPDEAMPIALHLVNSSFNAGDLSQTCLMTGVFSQIFDVIENGMGVPLDRESVNTARFITHLRYFFVRVHQGSQLRDDLKPLTTTLEQTYPDAARCARQVAEILELRLGQTVTPSETTYLAMHIARLTQEDRVSSPSHSTKPMEEA